jgi:AbiTii
MTDKSTRIDEARLVAIGLLDNLETSSTSIDSLILKTKRLARLMRDTDAQHWLDLEMRGYPDNFNFSILGTYRQYAASCGRITENTGKYYKISLPELEAHIEYDQALISTIKPIASATKVDNFVEKSATEALMSTHLKVQMNQKNRYTNNKHLFSSIKSGIHSFATDMYIALELGDSAQNIFESARDEIDRFIRAHCSKAAEKLVAINERIAEDSTESRSATLILFLHQ